MLGEVGRCSILHPRGLVLGGVGQCSILHPRGLVLGGGGLMYILHPRGWCWVEWVDVANSILVVGVGGSERSSPVLVCSYHLSKCPWLIQLVAIQRSPHSRYRKPPSTAVNSWGANQWGELHQ